VVQVTTQQRSPNGSYALAEALTFVPGVMIVDDENNGCKLVSCLRRNVYVDKKDG
jgi:hypothetical protein